jgi:hypothetical protein
VPGFRPASVGSCHDFDRRAEDQLVLSVGKARQTVGDQETDRSPVPVPIPNFLCRATPSPSQPLDEYRALRPIEVEIPGAAREHLSTGLKTKDPSARFIAIHDATVKIRQADGCNVLIKQDTKKLFPRTRFFLMNKAPLLEQTCNFP